MLLRTNQELFVKDAIQALNTHRSTLGIGPTGFGKTVVLSAVIGRMLANSNLKTCVLAHRDELTFQNEEKFKRVNPNISTSIVDGSTKCWDGQVIFAMVQTLALEKNITEAPKIDFLVIDEAHHATASTYQKIIEEFRDRNPDLLLFGVTATPIRNDKGLLKKVFGNICHVIKLQELIKYGYLVPPRTFIIDLGIQKELFNLRKAGVEYDMDEVAELMDCVASNQKVVEEWQKYAGDRKTVVFCSTISHAQNVTIAFREARIKAALITGELNKEERQAIFKQMDNDVIQVIVNVAVLTEGWDYQPISCVVLLRPCSFKGTMIQMVGRGLRTVDHNIYPRVQKQDCIVLDFGTSVLTHGSLEQDINTARKKKDLETERENKICNRCDYPNPPSAKYCELCGDALFTASLLDDEKLVIDDFVMTEVDLLKQSNFWYVDVNSRLKVANSFNAMVVVKKCENKNYIALGTLYDKDTKKVKEVKLLCNHTAKEQALAAANDFMNLNETSDNCFKSKKWLKEEPSEKQRKWLTERYLNKNFSKYEAGCLLAVKFNRHKLNEVSQICNETINL
jgi:superfamily II DNA or RNA helicase